MSKAIVWFRRDLRLADNPALQRALDDGHLPIPVYVHAPDEDAPWQPGAASRAWLHRSLQALDAGLRERGSRLTCLHGPSLSAIVQLAGAQCVEAVYWNRLYEPAAIARDALVNAALRAAGVEAHSCNASLLVEPWNIATQGGAPYRVFTPFWNNARKQALGQGTTAAPAQLPAVDDSIVGVPLASFSLAPTPDWDAGFWRFWQPGENGAADLLDAFVDGAAHGYKEQRNFPDRTGGSKLSPHLHFGEISPRQVLARVMGPGSPPIPEHDAAHLASELGWREFAHHLLFHFPSTPVRNLSEKFAGFPWALVDEALLQRWQQGRTGIPLVDAGMRELWHTGWMHNRVRMVVASLLTKNLRYHWIHGARWFWDTLVDADLANNTQGWQWSAGTGADAAPYFRIFSPTSQAERFDREGRYIRRWLPELARLPAPALFEPWRQPTLARALAPDYPAEPMIDMKASRNAALEAYRSAR